MDVSEEQELLKEKKTSSNKNRTKHTRGDNINPENGSGKQKWKQ